MRAFLYPSSDLGLPESHYELKTRVTTIGRHPNNEISLLLESISRFHAKIEEQNDIYTLTDLNSSNGSFVNGERLASPKRINEKDIVTIGRADFTFSFMSPEQRKGEESTKRGLKTGSSSSGVNIVGDEESASTILSTQLNVESTPFPGSDLDERVDVGTLKKANERLFTLYKLSEVIRSSPTREEVLSNVMDLIFSVLPADRGVILTSDMPDGDLEPQLVRYRDKKKGGELTISRTIVQQCMEKRMAILSRDAKIDARFNASESIMASDIRSAMCIPLISKKNMIGILFVDTKESVRAFTEDDLKFIASFGNELAMTLDNMSLAQENIKNERLAAVGQTIAGLAHNIKNILQLAKGGIELMDGAITRKTMDEIGAYWPVVRRGIDRMQGLTQEMLDYSRQTKPELKEACVNEVLDDMARTVQQDRMDSGVEMEVSLAANVPLRKIDPDGLVKAIMNLLSNSVDAFDGRGGKVSIATSYDKETIYIRVADNGKGIPKDKLAKIFQPFFTTKGSKGTGLGLSMTKKYITDMGGELSVESEEGMGTTFTIALPPFTMQMKYDMDQEQDISEPREPTQG